jgi:large subunit ribosomal protein L1
MKRSRRYKASQNKIEKSEQYPLSKGVQKVKEAASAKFDESVELCMRLGVDPRRADQMVRGTVSLPHGTGKEVRVLVLTKGVKEKEAEEAGADFVGFDDMTKKIQEGWLDFDVVIATPDIMSQVGKLGKILGPRGLMPNAKSGTVTFDVAEAVKQVKAGKIDFRVDKYGILHSAIGKVSFSDSQLVDNIKAFVDAVLRLRPAAAKGQYIKGITLSSTMGPGVAIDRLALLADMR